MKVGVCYFERKLVSSLFFYFQLQYGRLLSLGAFVALLLGILQVGQVQASDSVYTAFFSNKALSGYDAVAYFTERKPLQGDKRYTYEYQNTEWFFISLQNLDLFKGNPEKYAPQYGGYCAWAVGANKAFAAGDPNQWSIISGKLYLNYNAEVKEKWLVDTKNFIRMGDENWPKMISD